MVPSLYMRVYRILLMQDARLSGSLIVCEGILIV